MESVSNDAVRVRINRWVYLGTATAVSISSGICLDLGLPVAAFLGPLLAVLTFPAGVIGLLCATPLIYFGIATQVEAFFITAPVFAIAGMIQWYWIMPRIFGRKIDVNAE